MRWRPWHKLEDAVKEIQRVGHPIEYWFPFAGRRYGIVVVRERREP